MSARLKSAGFHTTAVDHSKNRPNQHHPVICIDLANDESVQQVLALFDDPGSILYVHTSFPFGTCLKTKPTRRAQRLGPACPKTILRSDKFPEGVPGLQGISLSKVQIANKVYKHLVEILLLLPKATIITVESPTRSHLWNTKWLRRLISSLGLCAVDLQWCMWGGKRDSWSTVYFNNVAFQALRRVCDQQHAHLPWGSALSGHVLSFAGVHKADYPAEFCAAVTQVVCDTAKQRGIQLPSPASNMSPPLAKRRAAEAGRQPRGNLLPPVIPEFSGQVTTRCIGPVPDKPRQLTDAESKSYGLHYGGKILDIYKRGDSSQTDLALGIFRSPDQFLLEAMKLRHPFDCRDTLSPAAFKAMAVTIRHSRQQLRDMRENVFRHYECRASALAPREQELHDAMDPSRGKLVADKKILLFAEMCKDAGVHDSGLVDILANGVSLVGTPTSTDQFEEEIRPQAISQVQLMKSSRWSRKKVLAQASRDSSPEIRQAIWEGALAEKDKGWLSGPFTEAQLTEMLGPRFVASRRFGLSQVDKVRPIDDFSASLINSAYTSNYRLDLPGVDGVAIQARSFMEAASPHGISLQGRTLDLDSAYKQIMVAKSSLWASVIVVEDPDGRPSLFISHVLPFGATSAVYAFCRLSKAIHLIGERLFHLVWTNYIDDYPQLDLKANGNDAQLAAERLFSLLGWKFSKKDSKRAPMSSVFNALGVTFDLSCSEKGQVVVRNKESRVLQTCEEIDAIMNSANMPPARATSLRGRLQFAETHTFNRILASNLRVFQSRACGKLPGSHLTPEIMVSNKPRTLRVDMATKRILLFTDASLERDDAQGVIGMVAYVMSGDEVEQKYYFSEEVPQGLMRAWQERTPKIIATLELFAAVVAMSLLAPRHPMTRVFCFVDNEAARATLISLLAQS